MADQRELAARFLERHQSAPPLLLANAWDAGSARILAALGFEALATTSSGHAATLGRGDGSVTREEAIAHAATIVAAAPDLPVSADLEGGFGDDPESVAETVRLAIGAGLAGCSIEDHTGRAEDPIYPFELAVDRVAAAAQAAHSGPVHLVLTARAENHLHGRADLDDTIARLQAFATVGADVLYAPAVGGAEEIRRVLASVNRPLNVLVQRSVPPVAALAQKGVGRISVGGSFAFAALGGLVEAANELRERGTYGFLEQAATGSAAARGAFAAA